MNGQRSLRFAWWNLHNFAHYDALRLSDRRWPKSPAHYAAKTERILAALQEIFGNNYPDLLAVCEITREAARELAARLSGDFHVALPPPYPGNNDFQVAVFYRSGSGFTTEQPLFPSDLEDVTAGTRPMIPVHLTVPGHIIRFVACHWTAMDANSSLLARERLAEVLRRNTYDFLKPKVLNASLARHVVILGDLNEEPTSRIFEERLIGRRDRESSKRGHWRDAQVRRIRLYNAAWRYLGEQVPLGIVGPPTLGAAGTYFSKPDVWRTFDHLLVSGGLLGPTLPYFDEAHSGVIATPLLLDEKGVPQPFELGMTFGVSDHLPLVGRLVLSEASP